MIQMLTHAGRWAPLLALAMLVGACDSDDNLVTNPDIDPPEVVTADSLTPSFASVSYSGLPYGPIGMWKSYTEVSYGPQPFTGSQNFISADGIVKRINAARTKKLRIVLAMTGGPSKNYTTNGKFDFGKWKNKMNTYNSSTIKKAVAAGVSDGTIIGNMLIDEPETKRWGGVVTKKLIDQMATYAKNIFPTLPMGVNHGPPGYTWRTSERYRVLDWALYQYNHYISSGNVASWRDKVLSRARYEGVAPAFSLNILDGGKQDRDGNYGCTGAGQAGKGTYKPNCRMTPTQVKEWGRTLGVAGCALQMWRYDGTYMSKSANQDAFRNVASLLNSRPRRSCRRP